MLDMYLTLKEYNFFGSFGFWRLHVYRSRWSIESVQGHLGGYESYKGWKPLQIGRKHSRN
jgi:hypothetical protein